METEFDVKKYKELVKAKGITQLKLVQKFNATGNNIKIETIKCWTRKTNPSQPTLKNILVLSDILNVGANELIKNSKKNKIYDNLKPVKKVPIVGNTSCGVPEYSSMQEYNDYVIYDGDTWTNKLYCVIACGDSMSPEIDNDDKVICDTEAEIQSGDIVHYTIGNESAIKIYVKDEENELIHFVPRNPSENFVTKTIRMESIENDIFRMARVVEVYKKLYNNRKARLRLIGRA